MIPNHRNLVVEYFDSHHNQFNLSTAEGCGKFTEGCVEYLRLFDTNVGHLRKYGSSTQFNGHAVDAINYHDPVNGTYQSVDLLRGAEGPNAEPQWLVQQVFYQAKDWYLLDSDSPHPIPDPTDMVPWTSYDENGFQNLKQQLAYDYGRRPQGADFDVTVWAARVFHSCYMGPDKTPLGFKPAMHKHRPEWCAALGVSVDNNWIGE